MFFLFRILVLGGIAAIAYFIITNILRPSDFIKCGRCEGKGFWYAARGKETCDWCRGSGKLPRNPGSKPQ
jgi:DnaJ-class molecular chaperone